MLLTRLYLRNFRVYEDELDLELPPGLVGIYGPNGSGKSTLLEAVLWTLWGKARTPRDQIRSAGVGGDCVTEVEFEHEGHLYLVRRTLTGINSTPRLEARCDGLVMSQGVRDAERYVESILGMDDGAFRASVFAEQKQLSAFSDHSPAERLRLVLRLLGITPLDAARDAARKDARRTTADHERLRGLLADVEALRVEAADADAKAAAASAVAATQQQVAAVAEDRLQAAVTQLEGLDRRRQEYDALVIEGRGARQELDTATRTVTEQQGELDALVAAAADLARFELLATGLEEADRELAVLAVAANAAATLAGVSVPSEPRPADEAEVDSARAAAAEAQQRLAGAQGLAQAAAQELQRARQTSERSSTLSGEADCPVCGQALGDAFEQVQAHRSAELRAAELRLGEFSAQVVAAGREAEEAQTRQHRVVVAADAARQARQRWETADQRRLEAAGVLDQAWAGVLAVAPGRAHMVSARTVGDGPAPVRAAGEGSAPARPTSGRPARARPSREDKVVIPPSAADLARAVDDLRSRVESQRAAAVEADRLRVRLERRSTLERALATNQERAAAAADRLQSLLDKARVVAFDREALDQAAVVHQQAVTANRAASEQAQQAAITAAGERAMAEATAKRLIDAEHQHAQLAALESQARHLARVADLLSEFRNTVVASVGPRLAVQAAELFGELTDHEYDELLVDPETYQLQIRDGGRVYGLDRFSGSEIDLANLALRVAISEHIHFQSGGSIGLMVLDEVFGPLDEDRKARMLLALERLRGRFRQVLVVTHDASIKDQLPNAIEVVKLPSRRATAKPGYGGPAG